LRSVEVEVFRRTVGVRGLLDPTVVLDTALFRTGTGSVGTASLLVALVPIDRLLATDATDETEVDLVLSVLAPAVGLGGSAGLLPVLESVLAAAALFWALIAAALLLTVDPMAGRAAETDFAGIVGILGTVEA
jgi:succinate-acetate transporter protein